MPLIFDFPTNNKPSKPDEFARNANDMAIRATDAKKSGRALSNKIRHEFNHPINQKIMDASQSRKIIFYITLTIAFFFIIYWEYAISNEIYAVLLPAVPWLPFACCIAIAFYISVCLGETTTQFSLLYLDENIPESRNEYLCQANRELYDINKKHSKKSNWLIHPTTGFILALLFLSGIYLASEQRISYLKAAGEISEADFHVYLPVVLYGIEILLGIPAFFVIVWSWSLVRNRKLIKELTKARRFELELRRAAIENYTDYLGELDNYNSWAENNNEIPRTLIPPCQELRQLLIDEHGYNSANKDNASSEKDSILNDISPDDNTLPNNATEMESMDFEQENLEDDRVQDLLNLFDERIDRENQGL